MCLRGCVYKKKNREEDNLKLNIQSTYQEVFFLQLLF